MLLLQLLLLLTCLNEGKAALYFDGTSKDQFVELLNGARYVVGASDMRKVSWDNKMEDWSRARVDECDLSNQYYIAYAKIVVDLAVNNVTRSGNVYPDLRYALVNWWRGLKTYNFRKYTCPEDDKMCMYSMMIYRAETEKVGCTFGKCTKFKDENNEVVFPYKDPVMINCKFEWNGYVPGELKYMPGKKCDDCSNNCVDDLLCGTPDPSYGLRGYRG